MTKQTQQVSASPPLHSITLVGALLAIFVRSFPSLEAIDEVASYNTFSHRLFPSLFSIQAIAYTRLLFAAVIWAEVLYTVLYSSDDIVTDYLPGSKLKTTKLEFRGYFKQQPPEERSWSRAMLAMGGFTMWSWSLLGVAFTLGGILPLLPSTSTAASSPWLLRVALLSFECSAPTTLLVSAVVKYALWPMALEEGNTDYLKDIHALIEHNANSFMALAEIMLLGGLPIRLSEFSLAPLFGIIYVLFTWAMFNHWTQDKTVGPQTTYFFFDTTIGWKTSASLVALLVVLTIFYFVLCLASDWLLVVDVDGQQQSELQRFPTHLGAILLMMLLVGRVRD